MTCSWTGSAARRIEEHSHLSSNYRNLLSYPVLIGVGGKPPILSNFLPILAKPTHFKGIPLSAITNLFEFRCQQNLLLLLSYKICPCFFTL